MLLHHCLERVATLANDQAALVWWDHHFNRDLEVLLHFQINYFLKIKLKYLIIIIIRRHGIIPIAIAILVLILAWATADDDFI